MCHLIVIHLMHIIEELCGKMFDIGKGKQVSQYMYSITDIVYRVLLHIIY